MRKDHPTDLVRELQSPCAQERHEETRVDDRGVVPRRRAQPEDLNESRSGEGQQVQQRAEGIQSVAESGLEDVDVAVPRFSTELLCLTLPTHLVAMLNARPMAPNAMKASLSPLFGMYLTIIGMLSRPKNVSAGWSQNSGP